jgi:hypothetical protein
MEKDWPRVEPNGVDERSARHMQTNLKKSLVAFEEYERKAIRSGQAHNLKWLAQRRLDLEDEFQNSIKKFESLNKAFQPKVEFMINKVKVALLREDPIMSGKVDKPKIMEGENPVASGKANKSSATKDLISLNLEEAVPENVQESPKDSNGSSQSQRMKSMHEAENRMQLEIEELDQDNNKLLERKYLKSNQRCEAEKARIADEMSSGLENLGADTSLKRVYKPYAGRMDSWVQSSIINLNARNEKQASGVSGFREVRSEVNGSSQDPGNATKNFSHIPEDNNFKN